MSRPATRLAKRSLSIAGHRTSVSLEDAFWTALGSIATRHGTTLPALVASIDRDRADANLSSAIRVYVLAETQSRISAPREEAAA